MKPLEVQFTLKNHLAEKFSTIIRDIQRELDGVKYKGVDDSATEQEAFELFLKRNLPDIRWCSLCGVEKVLLGQLVYAEPHAFISMHQAKWFCRSCAAYICVENGYTPVNGKNLELQGGAFMLQKP